MAETSVSIVIPIRNEASYIEGCLKSIVAQTYPHQFIEVLILDGNSTDRTVEIVTQFTALYPWIKLLSNPQQTVPFALNQALEKMKGEIMIWLSGHCQIAPDFVEQCLNTLEETGAACVGGPIDNHGETYMSRAIALGMSSPFGVGNAKFRYSQEPSFVDTVTFAAYRKNVFEKVGHFNEKLTRNQDDEMNFRIRASGETIYLDPKIRSTYFTRGNLNKLWKQYFEYGYWKIAVIKKHPGSVKLRHLVPALFVLSLGASGSSALFNRWGKLIFKSITASYLSADVGFSLYQSRHKKEYFPPLLLIFPCLHVAYGSGFLWGLVQTLQGKNKW